MKYIIITLLSLITGSTCTLLILILGLLTRNNIIIQLLKSLNKTNQQSEKRQIQKYIN